MFDFTAAGMHGGLVASAAVFFVLQLARDRFFVDASLVVLHLALLAREVDVGILSAWHVKYC
jgi:hypothetical protein